MCHLMNNPKLLLTTLALLTGSALIAQLPAGFIQYRLAEGLNPTDMAIASDGHIFITEKNGLVRVVEDGALLPDPFLVLNVSDYNERGLGHIALHPDFPDSPYVYLYYTVPDGSHNRISRVRANGQFAVPGSEEILYECDPKIGSVHHGGAMVFGNDGYLYISTGENGPANDPGNDMGKVLRLNSDGSIPADNPFDAVVAGKYKSVYATGFRNPFSMAVQPETGRIFLCDVGNASWEEINEVLAGKDYGWPTVEGKKTAGQSVQANYKDPIYAYDHNAGCSIIGAAFYPKTGGSFPVKYAGRFFFADYCEGYIGVLNPANGSREQNLANGIQRPVCIRTTPQGDLYYLARAGIGGGSEEDNTASTDGSLWRVVYTGSDAPFVFEHPKGGLFPVGDTVRLKTLALGETPLIYQWQKNGADLVGADSGILMLHAVQLQDSATEYRCIVSNAYGSDTSGAALLLVTTHTRPMPVITVPGPDFLYRAGEALPFGGFADDAEEGMLPPSALTWKIDFHHDEHNHPALTPVSGFSDSVYMVQNEGEPDDNVWYRIYLTAKDSAGLSRTTWKDVYPKKTELTVTTSPPGIEVNVDGFKGISPYTFLSVTGLKRTATVPYIIYREDSLLLFDRWADGNYQTEVSFFTPNFHVSPLQAGYDVYPRADGFGLYGEYFKIYNYNDGPEGAPLLTRIDTTVNFEWLEGSPEPGYVPADNFTARWTGDIVPFFNDTLTFYTVTDDGVRLWINDSLLIDKWQPQPKLEYNTTLFLEGGRRYPVRMEYLEAGGAAAAQLFWGSTRLPKAIIPKSQLFPPKALIPNTMSGVVWLDSLANGTYDAVESPLEGAAILLFDQVTHEVAGAATTDIHGKYEIAGLPAGEYRGYVLPPLHDFALGPGFGLNPDGYTGYFTLTGDEKIESNFSFLLLQNIPTASRSWSVSPNPGSGLFRFKKHFNVGSKDLDIRVFDRSGKLVLEKQLAENEWETTLDLTGMAYGVYTVVADGAQLSIVLVR